MPAASLSRQFASPLRQLQALLVLALALGGGGVGYGLFNLAIQLAALLILAVNAVQVARFGREAPRALLALVLLTLALPLAQLVPLPPALWQALPGGETVIASHALAGIEPAIWFPSSLDRARTLVAFCGLLAPATIVAIGWTLPAGERRTLAWTLALSALAAFLLGAVQLSSGNSFGLLFPERFDEQVLYGTFANRNSTALLFVLGLAAGGAAVQPAHRTEPIPTQLAGGAALAGLLALGTVLTQSRSGMALLLVSAGFVGARALAHGWGMRDAANRRPGQVLRSRWASLLMLLAVLAIPAAVALSAVQGGRAADSLVRYSNLETERLEMWEDAHYAARQYWPVGSGMGTFDEVFQLHESLEHVSPRTAGRAHNDWLELAMEAGLFGLALAAGWLFWCLWQSLRPNTRHELPHDRWMRLGAGVGIGCVALQSLLDYPLRNQTLLCAVAVLLVMLAPRKASQQ